jgi:hypothetical protein
MEIYISVMRNYYEIVTKNASELFWEITQNQSFKSTLAEEHVNIIVRECQRFGNEIWTAISRLRNDAKGKENADTDRPNCINDHFCILQAGDDYCKKAVTLGHKASKDH